MEVARIQSTEASDNINNLLTSLKKTGIIDKDSPNQQKSNWILKK